MADFGYIPTHCQLDSITYNTIITKMEGMKRKARLKSPLPVRIFLLEFDLRTQAERDLLFAHYKGQTGSTVPFNWINVPDYVADDASIYVRYDSYKEETIAAGLFKITLYFSEEIV